MAGNGGYQRPDTPATNSGPGSLSQRTDGGPGTTPTQAARYISGRPYGEGKILNAQENSAPLAGGIPTLPSVPATTPGTSTFSPSPTPLSEPGNPNIPLTHGQPFGPGDNSIPGQTLGGIKYNPETGTMVSSSMIQSQYQNASNLLKSMADSPDASPALQYLANKIGQGY